MFTWDTHTHTHTHENAQLKACEKIPTKKQLLATIASLAKQPATKVATGIKQVPTKLAVAIKQVSMGACVVPSGARRPYFLAEIHGTSFTQELCV
eukprot:1098354-Pelagomonas_calceolata.AAC.5